MKIILSNEAWHIHSPSQFTHNHYPIWIIYNGKDWGVAVNGGWSPTRYRKRDDAAEAVSIALGNAANNSWLKQ